MTREIPLDQFPTPEELWARYSKAKGYTDKQEAVVTQPYFDDLQRKPPRYYQHIAINRTVDAIARGQDRILLVMATGTGKTFTAFQIIWRLWKAGAKKRITWRPAAGPRRRSRRWWFQRSRPARSASSKPSRRRRRPRPRPAELPRHSRCSTPSREGPEPRLLRVVLTERSRSVKRPIWPKFAGLDHSATRPRTIDSDSGPESLCFRP